jgi:penicillin amidase
MKKWFKRITLTLLVLLALGAATLWWLLRGSLPTLDGELALGGLSAPASIERDALGVVTITAANEADAARALGYVHAQERFFEMDLLRRSAAGELSALFGEIAIERDRGQRQHRMRARAREALAAGDPALRPVIDAYVAGANAGLADLSTRPWPYLLLRQTPEPWRAEDALLAGYAMYFNLQDAENSNELTLWRIRPHLPPSLYALLTRDGTPWDAPLQGEPRAEATLPTADAVDLRKLPMPKDGADAALSDKGAPGSNNFAVGGALTAHGAAIVADDMHLGLRAPNIWFRARLRYADPAAPGGRVDATGFTLPGLPVIVVGSNGHVAWAFTNSYADTADWRIERACGDRPAPGCPRLRVHKETIAVAGGAPVFLRVEETAWGPVLHRENGKLLSLRWNAHLPGALNFGLKEMVRARDVGDALRIADRTAIPTQNLVLGDAGGRIAWRLLGPIAQRGPGCAPALPQDAADPASAQCPPWPIATDTAPLIDAPADHRLWTANNRLLDGAELARIGDASYAFGPRALQIRDGLRAKQLLNERDLLAIQLDDRALFLADWHAMLLEQAKRGGPALQALAAASQRWEGRASPESVSYRIVRAWRQQVHSRIANGLTAPAQAALGEAFEMPNLQQFEAVVQPLLRERPPHLLPRRYVACGTADAKAHCRGLRGWDALLEDAAHQVQSELSVHGALAERTWGERNTADICHPLARALPVIGKATLCMPRDPLPGDGSLPRVQSPDFGASQRMVVAPGREAEGIAHMPGGQSGHPLSPFWGAGHADWVQGRPSPFLPGARAYTLKLTPATAGR